MRYRFKSSIALILSLSLTLNSSAFGASFPSLSFLGARSFLKDIGGQLSEIVGQLGALNQSARETRLIALLGLKHVNLPLLIRELLNGELGHFKETGISINEFAEIFFLSEHSTLFMGTEEFKAAHAKFNQLKAEALTVDPVPFVYLIAAMTAEKRISENLALGQEGEEPHFIRKEVARIVEVYFLSLVRGIMETALIDPLRRIGENITPENAREIKGRLSLLRHVLLATYDEDERNRALACPVSCKSTVFEGLNLT